MSRWERLVIALAFVIPTVIAVHANGSAPIEYEREPQEIQEVEPKEIRIEVVYNWDKEKIVQAIHETFPESPSVAVAVATCESGLTIDIQSQNQLSYGQEQSYGLFQIHAPDWDKTAKRLGYDEYKTNPHHNLQLARYIYDQSGWKPWTCHRNGMYKKHL